MSKRNRVKRQVARKQLNDLQQSIHQTLRTDFSCTEEEIEMIDLALRHMVPPDVAERMESIHNGELTLSHTPNMCLEVVEGFEQEIKLPDTNHAPFILLEYLEEKYGKRFGFLYWHALTSKSSQDYRRGLQLFKKTPLLMKKLAGEEVDFEEYPRTILATHAKMALDYLAPLARSEQLSPVAILILAAGIMDRNMTGEERSIPEDAMIQLCQTILTLWQAGYFSPGEQYPYTLEETLAEWQEEDGSEVQKP